VIVPHHAEAVAVVVVVDEAAVVMAVEASVVVVAIHASIAAEQLVFTILLIFLNAHI
jgi:hypothetical protein